MPHLALLAALGLLMLAAAPPPAAAGGRCCRSRPGWSVSRLRMGAAVLLNRRAEMPGEASLIPSMDGLERMSIHSALSRPNIRVVRWPGIAMEPDNLPRPETGAPCGAPVLRS